MLLLKKYPNQFSYEPKTYFTIFSKTDQVLFQFKNVKWQRFTQICFEK